MASRIPWTWEETVLAGWAAECLNWQGVNMRTPIVKELSLLLKSLPIHPDSIRPDDFRSIGSVGRKINSLRAARPGYMGVGQRVTEMEAEVSGRFFEDPSGMLIAAGRILERYNVTSEFRLSAHPRGDADESPTFRHQS